MMDAAIALPSMSCMIDVLIRFLVKRLKVRGKFLFGVRGMVRA